MTATADGGGLVFGEASMVRTMRSVAGVAVPGDHRRMHRPFFEFRLQRLMAGVAKIRDLVTEYRRTHDGDSMGGDRAHPSDDQTLLDGAMRVVATGAVTIGNGRVDMRLTGANVFGGVTAQTKVAGLVGQQRWLLREVRGMAAVTAIGRGGMLGGHRQSKGDLIMASKAERGPFFANQMFGFGMVRFVTGGAVLLHIGRMLRFGTGGCSI